MIALQQIIVPAQQLAATLILPIATSTALDPNGNGKLDVADIALFATVAGVVISLFNFLTKYFDRIYVSRDSKSSNTSELPGMPTQLAQHQNHGCWAQHGEMRDMIRELVVSQKSAVDSQKTMLEGIDKLREAIQTAHIHSETFRATVDLKLTSMDRKVESSQDSLDAIQELLRKQT